MPRGKFICNECRTGKVDREGSFSKEGLSFLSFFGGGILLETLLCGSTERLL